MSKAKGGLGRGLGALLAGAESPSVGREADSRVPFTPENVDLAANYNDVIPTDAVGGPQSGALAGYREVDPSSIAPNPQQPRTEFDPDALAELVHSIREVGVLQPPVVRETTPGNYELIMGERRLRACRELGMPLIPVIVRATGNDAMLRDALLENLHRSDLNPLEEAAAYQQLMADFGATHEQLAERIGRSRPQITNTIRLLNLPPAVQRRVAAGILSAGHARAILGIADAGEQESMATRIVAEGLSVRNVEELVALGRTAGTTRKPRVPKALDAAQEASTRELADALGERLETRVKIELHRAKGSITIEVGGIEDLHRVAELLLDGPERSA